MRLSGLYGWFDNLKTPAYEKKLLFSLPSGYDFSKRAKQQHSKARRKVRQGFCRFGCKRRQSRLQHSQC